MLKEQLNHATRIREQVSIRRAISIFISIYIYIYEKGKKYDTIVSSTEILTLHRITLCSISKLILRSFFSFFFLLLLSTFRSMNSTSCFTPTVQIAYLIEKKKRKKGERTRIEMHLRPGWNNAGEKIFFPSNKKKGREKKKYPLWKCPSTWHHRHIAIFFHGSRLRFSLFIAKPVAQPRFDTPPLTYTCTHLASPLRQVVAIEIYATKGVRERKRRDKEKFSKILQEDVSRERGYSSSEEESPI